MVKFEGDEQFCIPVAERRSILGWRIAGYGRMQSAPIDANPSCPDWGERSSAPVEGCE